MRRCLDAPSREGDRSRRRIVITLAAALSA
jgi:hypothetical protein